MLSSRSLSYSTYIYIPLGGANSVVVNTVLVFPFVALWHDLTFRLLALGWLVSLFIIPELCATVACVQSKQGPPGLSLRFLLVFLRCVSVDLGVGS